MNTIVTKAKIQKNQNVDISSAHRYAECGMSAVKQGPSRKLSGVGIKPDELDILAIPIS